MQVRGFSVGSHYNVYAIELFVDKLAVKSDSDPIELRLKLLNKSDRLRNVLNTVADRINWAGSSRGTLSFGSAVASTFGSHDVAQVLELERVSQRVYQVNKVVRALNAES